MKGKNRIHLLDELRGLCILMVVIYHLFYSAAVVFNIPWFKNAYPFFKSIQPALAFAFILISGISFNLSHNNTKRGTELLTIALAITLVTALFMPKQVIWFGILHFLAVANLFCGGIKKSLDKIPFVLGIILSVVLFVATYNISRGHLGISPVAINLPSVFYSTDAAMMFGVHSSNFWSADYVPMLPWIFLFTTGIFLGRHLHKLPVFIKERHLRPLAFVGRHTLVIYIIHQPIIMAVLYLLRFFKIV